MPTIYKTADSAWTTWSAAATNQTDGVVDSTANPTTAFTIVSISVFLSSLRIESTFNPSGNTLAVTGGSGYSAALSSYNTPSGYTLYLAPGKTASFNYIGFNDTYFNDHVVYVDSNARLNTNARRVGTTAIANVTKSGPGTWRISSTENSSLATASDLTSITIAEGTLLTESGTANPFGTTNTLRFDGGTLQVGVTRSFGNFTSVLAGGGTISPNAGVTATFTNSPAGTGTLTIGGAGNVAWNNNIERSLVVNGLLTMGLNNRIGSASGLTISGGGTIAMNNGDLGADSAITATGHTGAITGTCTIKGGVSDFASDFQGTVNIGGGIITLRGASSGSVASVGNFSTLTVRNTISGGGGGSTTLNGNGTLNFAAAGKFADTRSIAATATTTIGLSEAASIASPINATDTTTITLRTTDTTTNTYSGTLNSSGASGTTKVMALTDGTLILSGSVTGAAGRTYNLNADSGYAGTIRVTGSGFTTSSVTLSRGKLDLNRVGSIGLGGGLTAATNATVACYSTGAYAAQLTGNLTLSAGSIMKFGAA